MPEEMPDTLLGKPTFKMLVVSCHDIILILYAS